MRIFRFFFTDFKLEDSFLTFARSQTSLIQSLTAKVKDGEKELTECMLSVDHDGLVCICLTVLTPLTRLTFPLVSTLSLSPQ